jgi:hypothetical protein
MTRGAKAALFFAAFAAAIVFCAGPRIASGRAAGPPVQPSDLAVGITDYANSEVDAAMAESNAVVAQVAQIELPVASTTPTVGGQATSAPAGDAPSPSAPTVDPPLAVGPGPGPVVILAAPEPIPPAPLADPSLYPGPVAQHDLEQSAQKTKVVIHKSRSIVSRSTFLRAELSSSATASDETSSSSSQSTARSTVRSSVKSSASGGRSQPPADPNGPLPFPPLSPNAPAPPNSGVSPSGGAGGQGALLLLFVPLAALAIFGIHRLLRRVHWSGLRMPRRGAVLPWRPG